MLPVTRRQFLSSSVAAALAPALSAETASAPPPSPRVPARAKSLILFVTQGGMSQMDTGTTQQGFPSLGAWLLYGLGSENPDLPGFCVMVQKNALVNGGPVNWGAGFLGATFQGTYLRSGTTPILYLDAPAGFPPEAQ